MKSKLQITTIQAAFTIVCFCFIQSTALFSQAISEWRSVTSGDFTNPGGTVWEKNVSGTWTLQAAAAKPSGSCNVTIRAGHTVSLSSTTSILGLTIEAGAVFNSTAAATAPITFRVGTSSSADITAGFTHNTTVIQNDGTFGAAANAAGANGGINLEVGKECQTLTLQGTGICNIGRTRFLYPAYQASTFNINQSMWLGYAAGTSLTTYYNNAANTATESNTINLAAGKTVTLVAGASFHGSVSGVTPPTNPQGTMTYNISGTLDLSATTSGGLQTSTAGAPVLNLTIKNGGIMKLGTSFGAYRGANTGSINMTIESGGLIDGSLLTSGFTNNSSTLNTGSTFFLIQGTGAFKQPVSTSTLFPIGYDATHYNPITLNNGGGVVFSASVVSGNTPSGLANATKAINRTWTITPATTPATADVAFGYSTADANAACIPANGMQLMSYSGSVWGVAKTSVMPSVGNGTDFQVAYSGVSFASTTFTLSNVAQIPVELMTFKGHTQDANNVLEWATATELNNQEFVIERSLNGVDFQKIGSVKGAGNSNQINNYTFTDVNAPLSIGYYQLRQIDLNGRETVSKSITIAQKGRNKEGVVRLYPSVTNAILTLDFVANTESTFKVMDLLGRTVLSKNNKNSEGLSSTQLDVSALSSGMYILSFESATTKMVQKFEKR
jgi:Secretion system C-terminal sorting domain